MIKFQFWKFVKCRYSVVKQEHMMSTVLKHVVIARIMKPVTLPVENVMIMGVQFRGLNRLFVLNVVLDITDLIAAQVAVRTVKRKLVTVTLENVCMVVHLDIKSQIAAHLASMDITEKIAPRHVETVWIIKHATMSTALVRMDALRDLKGSYA